VLYCRGSVVMLLIALVAGRKADRRGRKPVLLVGFAILPARAFLYTLSNDRGWLIAVQLLDGVGAGIFGVLTPLVVADLMRGTCRYNLALGMVATAQGIGASLSGFAVGLIVAHLGYSVAFFTLGCIAGVALMVLLLMMPETASSFRSSPTVRRPLGPGLPLDREGPSPAESRLKPFSPMNNP
jgi:MFS family permease